MTLYLHYWTLISFSLLITTSPYWSALPKLGYLPVALALLAVSTNYRKARGFVGLALACVVILMHGHILRYQTETLFQAGQDITIIADVDSLFTPINFGFQGIVVVRSINGEELSMFERPKIRLTSSMNLQLGDQISARIHVKPIYGVMNEVGFDAEQHALVQKVVGSGSISQKSSYYIINAPSLRAELIESVKQATRSIDSRAMVMALMFGSRDEISAQRWDQLKQSGLSHLIAISGLHIGIAFGIGWSLGLGLLRGHSRFLPAPMILGIMFAAGYAWLAGFSIPTQRALTMCLLLCIIQKMSGTLPNSLKWLVVLAILLMFDPFAVASASLWMSMLAVAIIFLYQGQKSSGGNVWVKAIEMQLFLVVLMSPIVVMLFHGVSVGAIAYNLIFVPWFSFVVIPLVFLCFACHLSFPLWDLPWLLLDLSLKVVERALAYASAMWVDVSSEYLLWGLVLLIGVIVSRFTSKRFTALLVLSIGLGLMDWRTSPLWRIFVLDVGHGLSVVVQQQDQALVYDTGASWQSSSIAEQIVSPLMVARGIRKLDYLIVSHFDNDHAGGVEVIKDKWQPKHVITSQTAYSATPCIAGNSWQWGEIQLQALWPPTTSSRSYNPHSCVLKIKHDRSATTLLLTGDIDAISEWILIREGEKLNSDILIVPHHGSKTSSTRGFVEAVSPDVAVASLAKGGRWRLPDDKVVLRYKTEGAKWMDTGIAGQIVFEIYPQRYEISALRELKGNTWYRQMLRNGVE